MKKKIMQTWFIILFVFGLVIGYILPGDVKSLTRLPLSPAVYDMPKRFGQLDNQADYFKYSVLSESETGSIELLRVDDKIPMHVHPKENHFVYIYKGKARGTIGEVTAEVLSGQLVVIPAGVPHKIERIGDTPVEIILFSTPPFNPKDSVMVEEKVAQ